jgi:GT2 family glycosyltransferase
MDERPLDLSIVVVSWNVRDLLRRCLASILSLATPSAHTSGVWHLRPDSDTVRPTKPAYEFEILVVDSASEDDSPTMVRTEFPSVRLCASQENLGYARGNNLGIQKSRGRYVLLLNPDTEVLGSALTTMIDYLEAHPGVGILGPQLLYPDGSVQSSRRRFPSLGTALVESTVLQRWFPRHPVLKRYYMLDRPDRSVSEVDWVTGACLVVQRAAIEQTGLLDESFFMYSEELDWQKRMRARGWKVVFLPSAQVVHHEGKSSEQIVALRDIWFHSSKVRYFKKHHGGFAGELLRRYLLFTYFVDWAVEATKYVLGHKRELRRARMRAYRGVLASRLASAAGRRQKRTTQDATN